ncbi:MAG TPA: iron ABC transporter permease [Gemmatimonadales bacterium]|nr:iron ABC transporter permease [Gemmatimonadales bacterium]
MKWLGLALVAAAAFLSAVVLGPAHVPLAQLATSDIVRTLRLPRALLAFLVGGSLALSGAGLQALVRNPLADPFLLGLSGGAGLGAVTAIALHLTSPWALPLAAFVGALLAMALVYRLGLVGEGAGGGGGGGGGGGIDLEPRVLILAGVAVGAFSAAVTTAIVSLSDAAELRNAFLWLWGGLSGASWDTVLLLCVYAPLPIVVLLAAARPLDLLALGEEPARYLGADVESLKRRVYVAASLLTAAAVAVSGVIGFVGLVVPHAMRTLWGHRHRALLPAAFLGGGALLALSDTVARVAVAPRELPVGIVTALVGVPVFALLLRRWTAS